MHTAYEIGGLPAHPLLVHAAVVLLPLAALCTILHAVWPAARARLGIVPTLLAVVSTALVPVTVAAGHALANQLGGVGDNPLLLKHEHLAGQILPWSIALTVVAFGNWVWRRCAGSLSARWLTVVVPVVTVIVAVGLVVAVVRAGDAGARATWQ